MNPEARLLAREFARRQPDGADIFRLPRPPAQRPGLLARLRPPPVQAPAPPRRAG